MRIYIYFLLLLVLLPACSGKPENIYELLKDDGLSDEEKLELIFEDNYLEKIGFDKLEVNWLKAVYKIRDNKALFCEDTIFTTLGKNCFESISNPLAFGIPELRLKNNSIPKFSILLQEIYMCINTARIMHDLNNGFIDYKTKQLKSNQLITPSEFIQNMDKLKAISLDQLFLKQGPSDTNYRYLALNLFDFYKKHPLDTTSFDLKGIDKEAMNASSRLSKAMISKGYLMAKNLSNQKVVEGLKEFQKDNGLSADGVINATTITALNESNHKKIQRAAVSLDKIRQSKIHQEKYVRINLPEYKLYFYSNNRLISVNRIVVGKTTNQTPELNSNITRIIVYPFWKVPASICKKEALPAIKKNISYLSRNHYKIFKENKEEVDPSKVNWESLKNFPYALIQEPGRHNSLGVIKFEFANSFSVYVHDTPSKGLFNKAVRNFSHGCMRCENPVELGKLILENDLIGTKANRMTPDSLDEMIIAEKNRSIFLKVKIPIYVYYQTVVAERDRIVFHLDIYARDEEYLKLLHKKAK
jgi:murein L,D-transpeptidase YcbB/YkuD